MFPDIPIDDLILSDHSNQRLAQRNLSEDEIEIVIAYGQKLHRAGAVFYYLRRCDLPLPVSPEVERLVGTAVVLSRDETTLITAWRNRRKGLKTIRCKPEYSLPRARFLH